MLAQQHAEPSAANDPCDRLRSFSCNIMLYYDEYQDLFDGKINEFVSIPETFQYEKDISISIQGLEDRIAVEKEQGQEAYGFNASEIKKMEDELKNTLP